MLDKPLPLSSMTGKWAWVDEDGYVVLADEISLNTLNVYDLRRWLGRVEDWKRSQVNEEVTPEPVDAFIGQIEEMARFSDDTQRQEYDPSWARAMMKHLGQLTSARFKQLACVWDDGFSCGHAEGVGCATGPNDNPYRPPPIPSASTAKDTTDGRLPKERR